MKSKGITIGTLLVVGLAVALIVGSMLGAERLPIFGLNEQQWSILFDIRVPRILLGACVGASLAVAGAGLQALLRNPLAEPYLLGVSNGAALGTMLAFVLFENLEFARPVLAFGGAALASVAVYQMARSRAGMNVERLVLSGVIVTTFLSSVIVMLTTLLDAAKLRSFTFWLLGDLSQATVNGVYISFAVMLIGVLVLTSQARALNLMMIGERDAFDFGVEIGRVRILVFGAVEPRCRCRRSRERLGRLRRPDRAASIKNGDRQRQSAGRAVLGDRGGDLCRVRGYDRKNSDRSEGIAGRCGDCV